MAALDRQNSNLDDFVGLNWSSWIDRANIIPSDGSNVEEGNRYGKRRMETTTLRKADMSIYGHCPAHDDFYLVVCSHCGLMVKPQAFERHCEREHHGLLGRLCGPLSSSPATQQHSTGMPGGPSSLAPPPSLRERQDGRDQEAAPAALEIPSLSQHRPAKTPKEGVRFHPCHPGPLPPAEPPLSSEKAPPQKAVTGQPEDSHAGTKTYNRTAKKVYKKECDLDKHCGVPDPERNKLCTRQLMCNIHSIHQRRKVVGRSKMFDQLVTEQRASSRGRDLERLSPRGPSPDHEAPGDSGGPLHSRLSPRGPSPHHEASADSNEPQQSCHTLNNCAILRSRKSSECEEDGESAMEVEPPYPFNQSLPSSEGSDSEDQEQTGDLPATLWHPRPLGPCTFGSHTLGCSVFTFDRRLHHLRFAFSAMVERHLSACLRKKIPQATGLRSRQAPTVTTTIAGSSGRAGSMPDLTEGPSLRILPSPLPPRATGRENCSSGQSETRSNQRNTPGAKPLSSAPRRPASGPPGRGRPRNPVGRPSKARLREQALAGNAERRHPACGEDQAPPKCIRGHPLRERGRPQGPANIRAPNPSSQGPINYALAPGKKPWPPQLQPSGPSLLGQGKRPQAPPRRRPHLSARGRGRPPGPPRRPVSYDHREMAAIKRKSGGGGSPGVPLSPPSSQAPKSCCLSSPPHSGLLSWRGGECGRSPGQWPGEED